MTTTKKSADTVGRGGARSKSAAIETSDHKILPDSSKRCKPRALAVQPEGIPVALRDVPRWCVWRYLPSRAGGKWRKVPCEPANGAPVDATRPGSAHPFAACLQAYERGGFDGLGIVLGEGIGGVDVDDCRKPDGTLNQQGRELSDQFAGSYAEVSPSGTGWKGLVLLDGIVGHVGRKAGAVELYSDRRFFCVTGHRLPGHAAEVTDQSAPFLATAERIGARNVTTAADGAALPPADAGEHFLRFHVPGVSMARAVDWLATLDPDDDEPVWFQRRMLPWALQFSWDGFEAFDDWSSTGAEKYGGTEDTRAKYERAMEMNAALRLDAEPVTIRTIEHDAAALAPVALPAADAASPHLLESGTDMKKLERPDEAPILGALLPHGVAIFAGLGGTGKSTILATAAAHITNGKPLLPWEQPDTEREPAGVLWVTVEEDMVGTVVPRHEYIGGNLDRFFRSAIKRRQDEKGDWYAVDFDIEHDLAPRMAEAKKLGWPIKLIVCDSLPGLVQWGRRSTNNETEVKQLLGRLNDFGIEHGCCIAGIAHWNKKSDQGEQHRMSGSQAWRDTPRVSFTVEHGLIYINKANDIPAVGCTFQQRTVKELGQLNCVMKGGGTLTMEARRADFGPCLLYKDELLAERKADALAVQGEQAPAVPTERRFDRMCREVRDIFDTFDLFDAEPVPSGKLWEELAKVYKKPTGSEERLIIERLGLKRVRRGFLSMSKS